MATATSVLSNFTNSPSSPITTGSFTLVSGRAYLLAVAASASSGNAALTDVTDSLGNTWAHVTERNCSPVIPTAAPRNVWLYRCEPTVVGSATITLTITGTLQQVFWKVEEITGHRTGGNGANMLGQWLPMAANQALGTGLRSGQGEVRYLETFQDANNIALGFTIVGSVATAMSWGTGWTQESLSTGSVMQFGCAKTAGEVLTYDPTWSPTSIHSLHIVVEILDVDSPVPGTCWPKPLTNDAGLPYDRSPVNSGSTTVIVTAAATLVTGHVYLAAAAALRTNDPRTPTMTTSGSGWTFTEIGSGDTRDYNTIASPDIRLAVFTMHGGTGASGLTVTATYAAAQSVHGLELYDLGVAGTDIDTAQGTQGVIQSKGARADSGAMASATLDSAFSNAKNTLLAIGASTLTTLIRPAPPTGCRLLNVHTDNVASGATNTFAAAKRVDPAGALSFSFPTASDNAIRLLELAGIESSQTVVVPALTSTALYQPSATLGAVTAAVPHLTSTALYEPSVTAGAVNVLAQVISSTVLHEPATTAGEVQAVAQVISSTVLYDPTVEQTAPVEIVVPALTSGTMFEPRVRLAVLVQYSVRATYHEKAHVGYRQGRH